MFGLSIEFQVLRQRDCRWSTPDQSETLVETAVQWKIAVVN